MKKTYLLAACALLSMQLSAKDYFVKLGGTGNGDTWAVATNLQDAISKAVDKDIIHIAAGTYVPTALPDATVQEPKSATFAITKNISLIGGYPANAANGAVADPLANETILSGEVAAGNQVYHIVSVSTKSSGDNKVVLRGLSITKGNSTFKQAAEGEIQLADRVTINEAPFLFSRGAAFLAVNSNVELDNCVIKNNIGGSTSGSILYIHRDDKVADAKNVLKDCLFDGNDGGNSTAYIWGAANTTVTNCEFSNNVSKKDGGGLAFGGKSIATVDKCKFIGNTASKGGGMQIRESIVTLTDCFFKKNVIKSEKGSVGAAVRISNNAKVTIANCTMTENQGILGAALGVLSQSAVVLTNTIIEKGNINDTKLTDNKTTGAPYYEASAAHITENGTTAEFVNCTIANNITRAGGAIFVDGKGKASLKGCKIQNNISTVETPAIRAKGIGSYLCLEDCLIEGNEHSERVVGRYNANMVYASDGGRIDMYNSLMKGNLVHGKRGGFLVARGKSTVGAVINAVNCTFTQADGIEQAIQITDNLNKINVVSSTFVDNTLGTPLINNASTSHYNCIFSNNKNGAAESGLNKSGHTYIHGSEYYDANGAKIENLAPKFDRSFDLAEFLADNGGSIMTFKLDPDGEKATLALTKGMNAEELATLATSLELDAEKVKRDARGVLRAGRNMGAYTEGTAASGIENEVVENVTLKVAVENGVIYVHAAEAMTVNVYAADGTRILTKTIEEGINALPEISAKGYYILNAGGKSVKAIL